jgi:uncharacterized protein
MNLTFTKSLTRIILFLAFSCCSAVAQQNGATAKPKIRTITAFIRLDRQNYASQIADALAMLNEAKFGFRLSTYEVETVRITTQPFPEIIKDLSNEQALDFFHELDRLAQRDGFALDIGPAMIADTDDPGRADLLAQIIATTQSINGFIVIADGSGIHWNAVRAAARVIKYLEEHTTHSEGNFRFAAGAFPPAIAPFYPVSHTSGAGHQFAIGMESANIVQQVFATKPDLSTASEQLAEALGSEAQKVEVVGHMIETKTGWHYEGIDLTPVPLKDISIGAAMESLIRNPIGSPGSLSTALVITSAIRRIQVKQAGYSGLMLPVLEDSVLARRWEGGTISRDSLMSYSSVCSTGLDAIPLPGDISLHDLESIIGDVASLAVKWHKPLSVRMLPVAGKHVGEMTEFGSPYLVNIKIQKIF